MPLFRRLLLRHKFLLVVVALLAAHAVAVCLAVHLLVGAHAAEILAVVAPLTLLAALGAARAARALTRPVVELTRLADEISTGRLDVEIRFGTHVRCWEIKRCDQTACPAHGADDLQCWYVDGTPCRGVEPRFPAKLAQCRRCEVYQAHRGDEIVRLADAFRHMTRRLRDSQAELVRAERLAATGETVAHISHSLRNILDALHGGAYVYRRGVRRDDPAMQAQGWEMLERNLGAVSALVMNLLDFARERQPILEPCDVARLVQDVAELHRRRAAGAGATVEARCTDGAPPVYLDAHAVYHALVNLVGNALDALHPDRPGRVEIAAACSGDRLILSVADDGTGMTPEVRARILDGLFTTKGSRGTGLGLLAVQKTVREHGGVLEVESQEGKGSTFRIVLPLRTAPPPA